MTNAPATPETRLSALGLTLPTPAAAIASYEPFILSKDHLFISGQLSLGDEGLIKGRLGQTMDVSAGRMAAQMCALNLLAQCKAALGDLSRIERVVKLTGFVNADSDFIEIPGVIDGASRLMIDVFAQAGRHARVAVGCSSLPLGAAVEVDGVFAVC